MLTLALSAQSLALASVSVLDSLSPRQQETMRQLVDRAVEHTTPDIETRPDFTLRGKDPDELDGVEVAPNYFHFASWDIALGTGNLSACSALVIMYPRSRLHYLAHVMPLSGPDHLYRTVKGRFSRMSPHNLDIFVLPGAAAGNSASAMQSLQNIYSLLTYMGWEQRAQLVLPQANKPLAGLIVYEGQIFNRTQEMPRESSSLNLINRSYSGLTNPLLDPLQDP